MNIFVSQKFRFYSFLSMFFLVYLHGYNLNNTYLFSASMVDEKLTFTTFTEHLLANGLFRFRIPMLFVISGFLYALTDHKPYTERTKKRLYTLGIPYLLWSVIGFVITYLLEFSPLFYTSIKETGLAQISDKTFFISQYTWLEVIGRLFFVPIAFQLWFIRVLLFYNIIYPFIRFGIQKIPYIWFPFWFLFWYLSMNLYLIEGGILFFSLGVWIQKNNFDIEKPKKYLNPSIFLSIFIVCSILRTILAFQGYNFLNGYNGLITHTLYKIIEISGFVGIWFGCDKIVKYAVKQSFIQFLMPFSFMIYAFHVPILYYIMHIANIGLKEWTIYYRFINFMFIPILIIGCSVCVGFVLRKFTPNLYTLLTGGRGL